jgi:hypothetical protein
MNEELQIAAHQHFSAHCFNAAWDLIDKPERTRRRGHDQSLPCIALALVSAGRLYKPPSIDWLLGLKTHF